MESLLEPDLIRKKWKILAAITFFSIATKKEPFKRNKSDDFLRPSQHFSSKSIQVGQFLTAARTCIKFRGRKKSYNVKNSKRTPQNHVGRPDLHEQDLAPRRNQHRYTIHIFEEVI